MIGPACGPNEEHCAMNDRSIAQGLDALGIGVSYRVAGIPRPDKVTPVIPYP
jgi:hypothetical protein